MMILREKDRMTLIGIFATVKVPIEVWAYGSRVTGTAHRGSDLDLVIRTLSLDPLPLDIFIEITERIRDSNIPILVEMRDWAHLPESFQRNIERAHEMLYSSSGVMVEDPLLKYQEKKE